MRGEVELEKSFQVNKKKEQEKKKLKRA